MEQNFIDTFREEASGLMKDMESVLLKLDQEKGNKEILNEVFRVMHTLKGTSLMFGFETVGKITHFLENIYDLAREGKQIITDEVLNLTLKIVDHINVLLFAKNEKDHKKESDQLIDQLEKFSDLKEDMLTDVVKKEDKQNISTFYIVFNPTNKLLFRGINILSIFKELCELGNFKIIQHQFENKNKKSEISWGIYLITDSGIESIESVFMFVIDDCKIFKVAEYNIFCKEELDRAISQINNNKSNKKSLIEIVEEYEKKKNLKDQMPELTSSNNENDKNTKTIKNINPDKRINVDSDKLDKLMNLVSDLVTSNAMLTMAVKNKNLDLLENIAEKFERLTRQFRDNALSVRLVSVRELLLRFKRLVRDLSKELGKEVNFIVEGEDTEMDKNIIDNLSEPLIHIFRNAIDHGIELPKERIKSNKPEKGIIKLSAFYSGTYVYITIQDDGKGIDIENIRKQGIEKGFLTKENNATKKEVLDLLFRPGFSTAKEVTDVSGRGVGLDAVKNKITELQGEIEIDTEKNLGTTFTIKLQQTISIIDTLLVRSGNTLYLIPQTNILFCVQEEYKILFNQMNKRIEFEDKIIPYINLREIFNNKDKVPDKAKLIIVNKNNFEFAIVADAIIGEHQAVIKPLGNVLKNQAYFAGVSLLGDGTLAFMIDLAHMQEFVLSKIYAKAV